MKKFLIWSLVIVLLLTGTVALSAHFGLFEKNAETEDDCGMGDLIPSPPGDSTDTGTNTPSDTDTPDTGDGSTETPEEPEEEGIWLAAFNSNDMGSVNPYHIVDIIKKGGTFKLELKVTAYSSVWWETIYNDRDDFTRRWQPIVIPYTIASEETMTYEFTTTDEWANTMFDEFPGPDVTGVSSYVLYEYFEAGELEVVKTWEEMPENASYDLWQDVYSGGKFILIGDVANYDGYNEIRINQGGTEIMSPAGEYAPAWSLQTTSMYPVMIRFEVEGDYTGWGFDSTPNMEFQIQNATLYKIVEPAA